MKTCIALLIFGLVAVAVSQDIPYSPVAPELGPTGPFGESVPDDPAVIVAGDIGKAERALERLQWQYLVQRGWVKTPDNPGGLWLWSKTVTIDGRSRDYRLETDVALNIEHLLEPPTAEMLEPVPIETQ